LIPHNFLDNIQLMHSLVYWLEYFTLASWNIRPFDQFNNKNYAGQKKNGSFSCDDLSQTSKSYIIFSQEFFTIFIVKRKKSEKKSYQI